MYFRRSCKNWDCHNFQLEKPLCVWQEESLRGFSKVVTIRFDTSAISNRSGFALITRMK